MAQIITSNNGWGGGWVWVYTYKWSVNTYADLPSTGLKVWDVYNVVTEHTTAPKFPAWANLAWTGTEWDVLWWTFDLSEYQKKLTAWSNIQISDENVISSTDTTYTEWTWIDISEQNEISVEWSIVSWAAAWATAVQPWDLSGYQTTANMVTSLTSADDDHYPTALAVANAISWGWSWDVLWPASSTDWDIVLFDWATGKLIKDSWVWLSSKQDTLTAWANISITSNTISANPHLYIITESDLTKTTTATKWVAPYNTDYYYTNIKIAESSWVKREEWAQYIFLWNSISASSSYRNVRFQIWDNWTYIPFMVAAWTIATWSTYIKKAMVRPYIYSTRYEAGWALHLLQDDNTTYSAMTVDEWKTATATSTRSMRSDSLKKIIKYHSVDDTAYAASWDWETDIAPSKNAVYDKISAMDTTISWKADSSSLGTAATKNTWTSSWNVPVLDANWKLDTTILPALAITDTFTVSTTSDLTWLSSAEKWDVAIVTTDSETYILSADPYSTAANWKKLATPTDTVTSVNSKTWAVTLNADDISDSTTTNKFVTATDKSTWSWKQDALSTQTAYTSKWTSTAVPTITTNTLGQVTWITETNIAFPVTSVNWSTWAVSVSEFNPWWTATTGYVVKKTADGYEWAAESWAVTSVNGNTWAVTVSEFSPSNAGSTDQVLTKTAWGYEWANASGWIENDTTGTTTTVTKIRAGSEAEYALITPVSTTIYYVF